MATTDSPTEKPEEIKVWPLRELSNPEPPYRAAFLNPDLMVKLQGYSGFIAPNEDAQGKATSKLHKPVK